MREIPLTQGYVALVDDDDHPTVSAYRWCIHFAGGSPRPYARRRAHKAEGYRTRHITMHRMLVPGGEVGHINGNGLDNRRANLRRGTHAQNCANQRVAVGNTSGFKGVSWRKDVLRWAAHIRVNGKLRHLGIFPDVEAAAAAYDAAARKAYGPFAALNFPKPGEQSAHRVPMIGAE